MKPFDDRVRPMGVLAMLRSLTGVREGYITRSEKQLHDAADLIEDMFVLVRSVASCRDLLPPIVQDFLKDMEQRVDLTVLPLDEERLQAYREARGLGE